MKVSNLIDILKELPPNSEIELYHHVYCGGGDEDTFDEPIIFTDTNDYNYSYLTIRRLRESLEYTIGNKVFIPKNEGKSREDL